MRYFDISMWSLDELTDSIRERIRESKKKIPCKVKKHGISIVYIVGVNCYQYPNHGYFGCGMVPEFKSVGEAEMWLDGISWIDREGDIWVEHGESHVYVDNDGNEVKCHYEIREYDYEEYEDGEEYTEYSEEEKKKLSEVLYLIEKAKVAMSVYDYCCDQWSFGHGGFSDELKEEYEKFEKGYSEDVREDGEDDIE